MNGAHARVLEKRESRLAMRIAAVTIQAALWLVGIGVGWGQDRAIGGDLNVRIGPFASLEDARPVLDRLRASNIDFFIFPQAGDGSVEISAGVFKISENADRMVNRLEGLGLESIRVVALDAPASRYRAESVPSVQPQSEPPSEAESAEAAGPPLFEVRYGWFPDQSSAIDTYRDLVSTGFEPRLLVFNPSGRATLGLGVFEENTRAEGQVAELAERGFPNGRIYRVGTEEADARQLDLGADFVVAVPEDEPPTIDAPVVAAAAASGATTVGQTETDAQAAMVLEIDSPPQQSTPGQPLSTPTVYRPPSGSTDAPFQLTLSRAISYAMANSPELESQELQVDLSEIGLRRAWGLVQPKVAFVHTSTRVDEDTVEYYNRLPDGANLLLEELGYPPLVPPFVFEESHHTQLLLTQSLFAGGANRFRISGARAHRDATRSHREDRRAEILRLVQQAFFNLARQWEVIGLRRESLARADRSLESVERRFSLGLVPRAEVLRWKVQVSGERVQLIQARNLYAVGLEHFKRLIGYPPESHLDLSFPSDTEVAIMMDEGIAALDLDTTSPDRSWLDIHPAVAAAEQEADAARLVRRATSSDFWPTLDLDGSYGYLENDTLSLDEFEQWSARLRLSFSVWDGGARVQNRAEARTKEDLAQVQLRVVRDELFVNDRSIVADLRADLAALEEARAAVEQARETLESVSNKAALGLADYIQRIDAQVIVTQSEVAETSARYQFIIDLVRWWRIRDPERLLTGIAQ